MTPENAKLILELINHLTVRELDEAGVIDAVADLAHDANDQITPLLDNHHIISIADTIDNDAVKLALTRYKKALSSIEKHAIDIQEYCHHIREYNISSTVPSTIPIVNAVHKLAIAEATADDAYNELLSLIKNATN